MGAGSRAAASRRRGDTLTADRADRRRGAYWRPFTILRPGSCRDRVAPWALISCRSRHDAIASQEWRVLLLSRDLLTSRFWPAGRVVSGVRVTRSFVTRSFLSFADTGSASVFQRRQAQRRRRKPLPLAVQFLEPRLALAVGVGGDCAGASALPGDTTPPEIRSIAAPKGQTYGEGRTIAFRVNFNEPVVATGTPSLPITIGDTVRQAAWSGRGSGSRSLTFTLSVQPGDFAPAGVRVAGPIVLADGAAIRDRAGNELNSEASGEYPAGIGSVRVDAVGPSVSDFGQVAIAGKRVSMRVTFTEPVIVRGKPSISFTLDGAPRRLAYA